MEIIEPGKSDEHLWRKAKKRVSFKKNLTAFILVNSFLTAIWFLNREESRYFWPVWPMLGWGLGLSFQFYSAYISDSENEVENEYQKLKEKQKH